MFLKHILAHYIYIYIMKCIQPCQYLKHVHLKQHPQQLYATSQLESSNIFKPLFHAMFATQLLHYFAEQQC